MRLGLHVGYWGLGLTSEQQLALVKEAETVGYDSVWAAEAYGSDTATVLAWLAAHTSTIKLGSTIFQMPARTPALTAMTAATLDQLYGGRMRSRAACRSSLMQTLTCGAMSKPSSERPLRAAPSSSSGTNSATCSGENSVVIQPSAIYPAGRVLFGTMSAR